MKTPRDVSRIGTLLCVFSAVAYTAYNTCLRDVSERYDSAWINCVQASVSVVVFGVYLLWQAVRGRRPLPPGGELLALLAIGLITQIGGVLLVWAMSIVGVAVTATLQTGVMLAGAGLLGLWVLGERVTWPQMAAIAMITVSVVFFSLGAESAGESATHPLPSVGVLWGIAAAALAGVAFAVLTVGVRKTVTSRTSPEAVVFLVNVTGVVALGPWSVYHVGLDALAQTLPRDFGMMLAAGVMNLIAFLLVTKSLQMISVVRFNVLNNGLTTTLTVAVGVLLLAEPWNGTLLLGLFFSMVGILAISLTASTVEDAPSG